MSITQDSVVTLHYTLKDDAGQLLERSPADEPVSYLHGHGNLIPGLERELSGKNAGDRLSVQVAPAEGYGEYDKDLVQDVPRDLLKDIDSLRPGMRLTAQTDQGARSVTVTHIADDTVTLDANHPLAGKQLHFEIEITGVRDATSEELEHGHVHGPGDGHG